MKIIYLSILGNYCLVLSFGEIVFLHFVSYEKKQALIKNDKDFFLNKMLISSHKCILCGKINSTQLLAYPKLVQTVLSVSNQIGIL